MYIYVYTYIYIYIYIYDRLLGADGVKCQRLPPGLVPMIALTPIILYYHYYYNIYIYIYIHQIRPN